MTPAFLKRFWDRSQKIGVPITKENLTKIDFIFIRNDGWSIGCEKEAYAEVFDICMDTWICVLDVKSEGLRLN